MVEREDHAADSVDSTGVLRGRAGPEISAGPDREPRPILHERTVHHHTEPPESMRLVVHLCVRGAGAGRESDMNVIALVGELRKRREEKTLPLREMCGDAASGGSVPLVYDSVAGCACRARLGGKSTETEPANSIDLQISAGPRRVAG